MVGNAKFGSRMDEPRSPRANQQRHHLTGLFGADRLLSLTFHKPTSLGIAPPRWQSALKVDQIEEPLLLNQLP
jgi:hypothetical protein